MLTGPFVCYELTAKHLYVVPYSICIFNEGYTRGKCLPAPVLVIDLSTHACSITSTHALACLSKLSALLTLLMMRAPVCLEVHWFNYVCIWYYLGISLWFLFWRLCQNLAKNVGPLRKERSSWEISAFKAWLSIGRENEERNKQQKCEWWGTHKATPLTRRKNTHTHLLQDVSYWLYHQA